MRGESGLHQHEQQQTPQQAYRALLYCTMPLAGCKSRHWHACVHEEGQVMPTFAPRLHRVPRRATPLPDYQWCLPLCTPLCSQSRSAENTLAGSQELRLLLTRQNPLYRQERAVLARLWKQGDVSIEVFSATYRW